MALDPTVGAELTDDALHDEIVLVGDLVVAASASEGPLSEDEIDAVLGVTRGHRRPRRDAHRTAPVASGAHPA